MDNLTTDQEIIAAIRRRLDWNNHQDSPFISVFTEQERAESWALTLYNENVRMAVIDTSRLGSDVVAFSIVGAREILGVLDPFDEETDDEWLVMHHIPARAIEWWIGREAMRWRQVARPTRGQLFFPFF